MSRRQARDSRHFEGFHENLSGRDIPAEAEASGPFTIPASESGVVALALKRPMSAKNSNVLALLKPGR